MLIKFCACRRTALGDCTLTDLRRKTISCVTIAESSGNVFHDLGSENADELQALAEVIVTARRGGPKLTQSQADKAASVFNTTVAASLIIGRS